MLLSLNQPAMPNNIVDQERCCPNNIFASCFQQLLIFRRVHNTICDVRLSFWRMKKGADVRF